MLTKSARISTAQRVNVILPIGLSEECGRTYVTPMLTYLIYEAPLLHPCPVLFSLYVLCRGNIFRKWKQNTVVLYRMTTMFAEETEVGTNRFRIIYIILYSLCMLGWVFKRAVVLTISCSPSWRTECGCRTVFYFGHALGLFNSCCHLPR